MRPDPEATPILTPTYLEVARAICDLHRLDVAGRNESDEADTIRDASDRPWAMLSEAERERARWLSDDLISITEPLPALEPMTAEAQFHFGEAVEALAAGDWDRALLLFRGLKAFVPLELLSYYRGRVWLGMGDPATAAVFLEHASRPPGPANRAIALHRAALDAIPHAADLPVGA